MAQILFDDGSVNAAIVVAISAVISMVSLSIILLHLVFSLAVPAYARRMSSPQERNFITSPLGFYIICLFVSNFISAIGGVMEVHWIGARGITEGPGCTTQAFLLQLGNNAAALWTAVISISALRTFMFRARSLPVFVTLPLIFIFWLVMVLFDALASSMFGDKSGGSFFYGVAGLWCWITPQHAMARLIMQYVWMWIWSFVSAVCFILVFLSVQGNIIVKKEGRGRSIKWRKRSFNSYVLGYGEEQYGTLVGTVGKTMCWFPISYIVLTVPIAVTRIAETYGFPVPLYAFVLAAVIFSLCGIVNPMLYYAIRHSLKHCSLHHGSDTTLRGSYGNEKFGTESFVTPSEKHLSPVSKFDAYPWTPTPTTREWVPPSPHHGIGEASTPSSSSSSAVVMGYAVTAGSDRMSAYRNSITSNAPPRQVPVTAKLAQRTRSFHRPMESISTVTSTGTAAGPSTQLSPVSEGESPVEELAKPQLTLPPAALIARSSSPSPNIMSPADLSKLAYVPLSPQSAPSHKGSETDGSLYNGSRAISPDLNALMKQIPPPSPTGPPPPPRKARRLPIPSVPVDVDESDEGSICSARPSVEEFGRDDIRPMSLSDITTRKSMRRADSMRTFWAAYEDPQASPLTPDMPAPFDATSLKRDTMRTFWAAYEDPSPTSAEMPLPYGATSFKGTPTIGSEAVSPYSPDFRPVDSSVFLKPSISAVGRPPARKQSSGSLKTPEAPKEVGDHRRSRSFTPMPTFPSLAVTSDARTSASAIARSRSPSAQPHSIPPTPSSSEVIHRTPRPQPGYL